jgi:hypothetical protein
MPQPNTYPAMNVQPVDVIGPYLNLQQNRRQNALAQLTQARETQEMQRKKQVMDEVASLDPMPSDGIQKRVSTMNRASTMNRLYALDPQAAHGIAQQQQTSEAEQQRAQQMAGLLAAKAQASEDPRGFVASAIQNPAYREIFSAAGFDPSRIDLNSPTFDRDLAAWAALAPQSKPIEVSPGASLARETPTGGYENAFTAPGNERSSDDMREYQLAQQQGYRGNFVDFLKEIRQAGAQQINLPSGYRWNAAGGMEPIPGGPAGKRSEGDKRAEVMFRSMLSADGQLAGMSGADTGSVTDVALGATPVTAALQGQDFKKYEAAGLRWAANMLYLKSGATATPDEIRSTWKQFFPQPGEGDEVKQQKAAARSEEIQGIADVYGFDAGRNAGNSGSRPQDLGSLSDDELLRALNGG